MKKLLLILSILAAFSSCKSSKKTTKQRTVVVTRTHKNVNEINKKNNPAVNTNTNISTSSVKTSRATMASGIIDYAKQFDGVRYKYGGTTKAGMDCSGLVFTAFKAHDISLPRSSRDMAKEGISVSLENVVEGDLLFFKTNGRNNSINHVGLVVTSRTGFIEFIHATTQRGVLISSLAERYWNNSFVEARRMLK